MLPISVSIKFIFLSVILWCNFEFGNTWNYQDLDGWRDVSVTCIAGKKQSPIDLRANLIDKDNGKSPIKFLNYYLRPQSMNIKNSGHSIELTGRWKGKLPSITGSAYSKEVYAFSNAHVHWSTDNRNGTEHSMNGKKHTAELHLVHLNTKYRNETEAKAQPDGIAVIAVLFELKDDVMPNPGMQELATVAQTVFIPETENKVSSFDLSSFLPNPVPSFFSYDGSLTTPPCSENVRWVVLSEPQAINSEIIDALRRINLIEGDAKNIRPLQEINNRRIKYFKN